MLGYSWTLFFCISEPCPRSSQLGEDQDLLGRIQCKKKEETGGISDTQTHNLAILKKNELNANTSHCHLQKSRLGEPH